MILKDDWRKERKTDVMNRFMAASKVLGEEAVKNEGREKER